MSVLTCWAVKGGSGTTVVAAALALAAQHPVTLVDLDGELTTVLGIAEPPGQGLAEWFASDAPPRAVADLAVDVTRGATLVPRGSEPIDPRHPRWNELAAWMARTAGHLVVDGGSSGPPPEALRRGSSPADNDGAQRDLLVTRACYLSLRRRLLLGYEPDGVILVADKDHGLEPGAVARSAGAPIVATVALDPAVTRAINAGLVNFGLPSSLRRSLRDVTRVDLDRSVANATG